MRTENEVVDDIVEAIFEDADGLRTKQNMVSLTAQGQVE